jgi:hypothetical protein
MKNGALSKSLNRPGSNESISVVYKDYTSTNTLLSFRNFLTISTTEKFESESYIDNGFFVSRITQMKRDDFFGRVSHDRTTIYEMPYKKAFAFFVDVH